MSRFQEVEVLDPEEPGVYPPAGGLLTEEQRDILLMQMAKVMVGSDRPVLSETERDFYWAQAFEEWLHLDSESGDARPENTVRAYKAAWDDFRACCRRQMRDVEGLDVKAWVEDLRTRQVAPHVRRGLIAAGRRGADQVGYSGNTINQYMAAISSFYTFTLTYECKTTDGRTVILFGDGMNPVKTHTVKRPKYKAFQKALWLDVVQLQALLQAIVSCSTDPRRMAQERRDFALFLSYLATAGRSSELRKLRWGDIERRGELVFYNWANKGTDDGCDEYPPDAWAAVEDYLRVAGRLETMQADDYIFTPLTDAARSFPNVDPETWDRNRPISGHEVGRRLRMYARRAGLEVQGLHVHTLRHSAYMLYRKSGMSLEERQKLLHHKNLATTSLYDHAIAGQRNVGWAAAATLLGLDRWKPS